MFSNLTDWGFKRTPVQALGFYIVAVIAMMIISSVLGGVLGVGAEGQMISYNLLYLAAVVAVVESGVLAYLVFKGKNKLQDSTQYIFVVIIGALGFFSGLLSLAIVAYMTTRDSEGPGQETPPAA